MTATVVRKSFCLEAKKARMILPFPVGWRVQGPARLGLPSALPVCCGTFHLATSLTCGTSSVQRSW